MRITLEIRALANGGAGIGRYDGCVVFVPFTVPGDVVEAEITRQRRSYAEASLLEVLTPSPLRVAPRCPVFGRCGGCDLQNMAYAGQVAWKERIFTETISRLGCLEVPRLDPAIPSRREYNYRSKARFQVRGGNWGFFMKRSTEVVDIEECPILERPLNRAYREIRALVQGSRRLGPLKTVLSSLEIGVGSLDKGIVVSLGLKRGLRGLAWKTFFSHIEGLKGLEVRDIRRRAQGRLLFSSGDVTLAYDAGGLHERVPIRSFSQINREQNRRLVERVMEYASLKGAENVVELYCGAGNLTTHLGRKARRVIAVDSDTASIEAARNALEGAGTRARAAIEYYVAEAAPWLEKNLKDLERNPPHVVVLDPPRGGDREAVAILAGLAPPRVVYVSCNPPTMARDMRALAEAGYLIKRASVIDLFPQTGHIEAVCLLERDVGRVRGG